MAQLAALHFDSGDWDVFVVEGLVRGVLDRKKATKDVLDRPLPDWISAVAIYSVKHNQRVRLANQLKGYSKQRRQKFYLEWDARARMAPKGSNASEVHP